MLTIFIIVAVVAVVAFIAWRFTSVSRGAQKRDDKILNLLDPLRQKLDKGESVSREEVSALAIRPEVRPTLSSVLASFDKRDLLDAKYNSPISQAEAGLAFWLMHPNEFGEAPAAIEHIQQVDYPVRSNHGVFHVFRYKMPDGHLAAKDGWLLGVVGPMNEEAEPYSHNHGAYSRSSDTEGSISPQELVERWVGIVEKNR